MHFHLPKPLHGWRAFIGEVGVVVLGVLLALGAGQVVDYFNQRAQLREAEAAMTAELRDDNLPQAFIRVAVFNCYRGQLDALQGAVRAADRPKFMALAKAYKPVYRTWDDEAWKAALASQVLVHVGTKRMAGWSTPYVLIPILTRHTSDEIDELSRLWAELGGEGPISPVQQDRLFEIISNLRTSNDGMAVAALVFMSQTARIGLTLMPEQRRALLQEARQKYGACVRQPAPEQLNVSSQLSYVNGALGNGN
jgi:hypothetical protein